MSKRLPHEIDTETLLSVIDKNQSDDTIKRPDSEIPEIVEDHEKYGDILSFLSEFNIVNGENYIKKTLLYSIYKAWSVAPLKKKEFLQHCNELLVSGINQNNYKVNQNSIKLTYDAYMKFKKHYKTIKSQKLATQFQDFIDYYSLKDDNYWIHVNILYFLYDKFTYEKKYNRTLKLKFFDQFCKLHFKLKVTDAGKMYAVSQNVESFFQPGQLDRMKVTYANQEKQEKDSFKKRKRKTSKPRSKVQSKNKKRSSRSGLSTQAKRKRT